MKEGLPRWFTCSWEHHINTRLKISYSVICVRCTKELCISNVTNCTRSTLNVPQVSFLESNTVYVKASTKVWEVQSSLYTFTAAQIFKIPPRKVNVTARLDHVLVEWNRLPDLNVTGSCQVKYSHTENEKILTDVLTVTLTPEDKGRLVLSDVESCRTYSVSVRCALTQAPWSYWSPERTIQTRLKKRDVKLDVWRRVSKLHNDMRVQIMWKGIPPNCPEDSFYLSAFVGNDSDELFGVNSVEVKRDEDGLVVGWTAPAQTVSGYVVDWTHDGDDFEWRRTKSTLIRLHGLVDKKPYNITVTPLFGNKTGPSAQTTGVCSTFTDPPNVTIVNLVAYGKSAHISWTVRSQDVCSDEVLNYTVFYGTLHGPQLNLSVKSTQRHVDLKNLNPDTKYSVHVVAAAKSGLSKSNERLFQTKRFDLSLIIVLCIIGILLLILSIALFCTMKKFSEKPVPNPGLSSLALWPQATQQKTKPLLSLSTLHPRAYNISSNMSHNGPPPRWRNCPRRGQPVAGKFLPMKTMLGPRYDEQVAEENRFHPGMLSNYLKSMNVKMGLLVDLTNTTRFYDRNEIEKEGIKYVKLQCKGHGECPSQETTAMFIRLCEHFIEKNPTELIVIAIMVENIHWQSFLFQSEVVAPGGLPLPSCSIAAAVIDFVFIWGIVCFLFVTITTDSPLGFNEDSFCVTVSQKIFIGEQFQNAWKYVGHYLMLYSDPSSIFELVYVLYYLSSESWAAESHAPVERGIIIDLLQFIVYGASNILIISVGNCGRFILLKKDLISVVFGSFFEEYRLERKLGTRLVGDEYKDIVYQSLGLLLTFEVVFFGPIRKWDCLPRWVFWPVAWPACESNLSAIVRAERVNVNAALSSLQPD
ncbi:hypothetical protein WMY93_033623, partial [Mugilogobius chulae]